MKPAEVLVLFSYRSHPKGYIEKLFGRLSDQASHHNLQLTRGALKDLQIRINNNHLSITESLSDRDMREFDLVYFELWRKSPEQALAAAHYLGNLGIPFFSREMLSIMPLTKIGQLAKLAGSNINLPDTLMTSRRELLRCIGNNTLGISLPVIIKASDGYGGKYNFLATSYGELSRVINDHGDKMFVVQEFIPNECDYRCLIMGGTIRLVIKRTRSVEKNTHLNNTSAGAEGQIVSLDDLSAEAQEMVLTASQRIGREDFSGVDLMLHAQTGKPYILEVNQTPQIEIGTAIDTKMQTLLTYMSEQIGER